MWERLSYYGMRALLVLYMVDRTRGGLGFGDASAYSIYSTYTGSVYLFTLAGGVLADRVLGQRRAVLIGGSLMMLGHFLMAVRSLPAFYGALALLVLGNGLFKPNLSSLVGGLYAEGDPRRESGFTLFYMGINTGALLAPLVVGSLGEKIGWHVGFASAGVGMAISLVTYASLAPRLLGDLGLHPAPPPASGQSQRLTSVEWQRLAAIGVITLFAALFWAAFEQAGGWVSVFTERKVDRAIFGYTMSTSWFQALEPAFVILLGPVFSALWVRLTRLPRGGPSTFSKVAFGLVAMGLGIVPLVIAARVAANGLASLWFIVGYYLISTIAELALSPVALSAVTRFSPSRLVSLMMGVWFLSMAAGNKLSGPIAIAAEDRGTVPVYSALATALVGTGLLLAVLGPLLRRWTHGADEYRSG